MNPFADAPAFLVCGYAAHIAAQLGAHIIKLKLPSAQIEQAAARKAYAQERIPSRCSPTACAMWCNMPSTVGVSSFSPAGRRRLVRWY